MYEYKNFLSKKSREKRNKDEINQFKKMILFLIALNLFLLSQVLIDINNYKKINNNIIEEENVKNIEENKSSIYDIANFLKSDIPSKCNNIIIENGVIELDFNKINLSYILTSMRRYNSLKMISLDGDESITHLKVGVVSDQK